LLSLRLCVKPSYHPHHQILLSCFLLQLPADENVLERLSPSNGMDHQRFLPLSTQKMRDHRWSAYKQLGFYHRLRSKLSLTHAKYLGKAELFKGPFGFIFRKLGGFPVERSENHNMVEDAVQLFNRHDSFLLALSPEGSRKKVERLRTGFYHIAKKASVPIVMVGLDFEKKEALLSEPFLTGDDEAADFQHIYQFYAPVKGKIPEQGMAHLLNPS
jgi:hypothetical protein